MGHYTAVALLLVINLGLIWLMIAAPVGRRTLRVTRILQADAAHVWSAVDPFGASADWHHNVIASRVIDAARGRVEQTFTHLDRHGAPIRRVMAVRHDENGQGFSATVSEDSALDIGFWKDFSERRTLRQQGNETVLTVEQTDRYKGLAFFLFRAVALRREMRALDIWLKTGRSQPERNGFEHPAFQAGLAVVSTLLLWPFFGLNLHGLVLSSLLTAVIVLHELGHLAAYRAFGHRSVRMIFVPLLGGIAIGGRPYHSRFEVATCALMGAGMSAFLVPVAIAFQLSAPQATLPLLVFLIILGAFNLLNLLPMNRFDGGQVLGQVFSTRSGLIAGSFAVTFAILAVGWRIGLPSMALIAGLAVFSLVSLMGRGSVKPRDRLIEMTTGERIISGFGLYAAIGLHGYAIIYSADRLFSGG